ncbi:hypothetical protein [Rickettsiella endosymbiont of Miltochrista miniata]|uniref:hypothetical protein n=1 Tax=Rickettsiella endosymbiont of Miltochrista miniata TaxID=3066239 RepID=UPI00313C65F4
MSKDVLLASLIEDTSNDFVLTYEDVNSWNSNEIKTVNLTPPELEAQYKLELMQNLELAIPNHIDSIFAGKQSFFLKYELNESTNETKRQILEEHAYCKK